MCGIHHVRDMFIFVSSVKCATEEIRRRRCVTIEVIQNKIGCVLLIGGVRFKNKVLQTPSFPQMTFHINQIK